MGTLQEKVETREAKVETRQSTVEVLLFTDIDDCFMATRRKFANNTPLTVASLDIHGEPRSYISDKQQALLDIFSKSSATIIPVTGRSHRTLQRIQVDALLNSWKVVSHGALIIEPNGEKSQEWLDYLNHEFPLSSWSKKLAILNHQISDVLHAQQHQAKCHIVSEDDLDCYVCIKCSEDIDYQQVFDSVLSASCLVLDEIKIHINGRNMALLPPYTQKQLAVEFLNNKLNKDNQALTLSMGDSLSDIPFMKHTDFLFIPAKSQISETLSW